MQEPMASATVEPLAQPGQRRDEFLLEGARIDAREIAVRPRVRAESHTWNRGRGESSSSVAIPACAGSGAMAIAFVRAHSSAIAPSPWSVSST